MRIVVGADHAGYSLKQDIAEGLRRDGHDVLDVGTHSTDPVDYPDYALALGLAITNGLAERGVLICGSGVGASIAASKIPGVRAAVCHDTYSAHQGVEHDDMNVIVLGARVIGAELAHELVRAFLGARFSGEARHVRRLGKVNALEQHYRMPRLINGHTVSLPPALQRDVDERIAAWDATGGTRRLFAGDASLWTGSDEASWIGWIGIVHEHLGDLAPLRGLQAEVRRDGFTHALLLGMGGSSLCPEVWVKTFGSIPGAPGLHVLDSTDPAQVRAIEAELDLARTLFIVSSKSGSTLEPNIFKAYFFDRLKQAVGADKAASRFVAITDPGSSLEKDARAEGFRHIYPGAKSIGGRYSALSNFGLVPAAVMGLDVERLLNHAAEMLSACAPSVPAAANPGLVLGTILGVAANRGVDKLTIVTSPDIYDLGAWLEQLIAESTGKEGKGIIPVDREALGPPEVYGDDRLFAYLRLEDAPDAAQDTAITALKQAGKPVVTIRVATKYALSEEFVRWEIATAIAGAVMGINPFNQPDVEASKLATRSLTSEYEKTGTLPAEAPFFEADRVKLFADPANVESLERAAGASRTLSSYLKTHLDRLRPGDYFALLAYLDMNDEHEAALQRIRHRVRDRRRVATCLGFGPRFLHSTGQGYKGGPNTGVFLQITCDDARDLAVPGQTYTFGVVKAAQARGDFQVLADRHRRAVRVHLGADVAAGLRTLGSALDHALS
jgi:transaldolase/glucose-6-phosphate isomerase